MSVPKLRFKEFDGDWSNKKIGNIASKVGSGSTPRGGAEAYTDHGIIFIRSQNVNNDQLLLDDVAYIPEETHVKMSGSKVIANDILLNITGASIGRSCVVPHDFTEANVNQHVCIIRTPNDDPIFVQSFLSSENGQNAIQSKQAGGGREGLNFQAIRSIDFHFPPSKEEQAKIASFLSNVDKKISQLTQKHELLSQYKQGMMQKLFSQQIRFKADDGSEFGEWRNKKVIDLFVEIKDKVLNQDIETYSITAGKGFVSQAEKFGRDISGQQNSNYIVLKPQDFSYNKGNSKTYKYGCVYLNEFDYSIAVPNVFISFRAKNINEVNQKFYAKLFEYHYLDKHLRLLISSSARMDGLLNVSKDGFFEINVPYPCLEEQTKIANFLSAIDQKIEVEVQQIEQAKTWKKGLLQQMFV